VFGVPHDTPAHVASGEIDAIHWVPLATLGSNASRDTVEIPLSEGAQSFPCLRVAGEVVWGLTYRILEEFLERLPDGSLGRSGQAGG
jgi:hypothetical protein